MEGEENNINQTSHNIVKKSQATKRQKADTNKERHAYNNRKNNAHHDTSAIQQSLTFLQRLEFMLQNTAVKQPTYRIGETQLHAANYQACCKEMNEICVRANDGTGNLHIQYIRIDTNKGRTHRLLITTGENHWIIHTSDATHDYDTYQQLKKRSTPGMVQMIELNLIPLHSFGPEEYEEQFTWLTTAAYVILQTYQGALRKMKGKAITKGITLLEVKRDVKTNHSIQDATHILNNITTQAWNKSEEQNNNSIAWKHISANIRLNVIPKKSK